MKATTLRVRPVEGCKLPVHNDPKHHIDSERSVPNVSYYRRALKRGDIAEVAGTEPARKEKES